MLSLRRKFRGLVRRLLDGPLVVDVSEAPACPQWHWHVDSRVLASKFDNYENCPPCPSYAPI